MRGKRLHNEHSSNLSRADEFHRCMLFNSFLSSPRLCFVHQRATSPTKLLLHNINHNLRYISFLVFRNNSFYPSAPARSSLRLYHRRKLRKQINNSREIKTLYLTQHFTSSFWVDDVAKNISRFAHFSFSSRSLPFAFASPTSISSSKVAFSSFREARN